MPDLKRYVFNESTNSYEVDRRSTRSAFYQTGFILLAGLGCFLLYFFVFTQELGYDTPKAVLLQRKGRALADQVKMLGLRMGAQQEQLREYAMRDNLVYRPVFGLPEISDESRTMIVDDEARDQRWLGLDHKVVLDDASREVDKLTREAYVQSLSFDQVKVYSVRAGDMASCIPSIYPVNPESVHITSAFGARFHPIHKAVVYHEGIDFAGKTGIPVRATGDGVVESTQINFSGYGNMVVIDHGFGYKTRYAHLREIKVVAGQVVIRGDQIGTLGNTGLSTGPHLHYEVIYRGRQINPWNFLNPELTSEEYEKLVDNG